MSQVNPANFPVNPDRIVDIPCTLIKVNPKWNMRFAVASGDGEKEKGQDGLVQSMAIEGQKTACTVRPNPLFPAKESQPYELIAGFGRYTSRIDTANGENDKILRELVKDEIITEAQFTALHVVDPTLRCVVKALTDEQARWENVEENLVRHSATAPDATFAIAEIAKFGTLTHEKIAARLNMSQGHVSKMVRIDNAFHNLMLPRGATHEGSPKISVLNHWREFCARIPVNDMDLIGKEPDKEKRIAAYLAIATTKVKNKTDSGLTQGKRASVTNSINVHAPAMGAVFGSLARQKLITVDATMFSGQFMPEILEPLVSLPKNVTDEERDQMMHAFRKAFDEALKTVPVVAPVAAPAPAAGSGGAGTNVVTPPHDSAALASGMTPADDKRKKKDTKGAQPSA